MSRILLKCSTFLFFTSAFRFFYFKIPCTSKENHQRAKVREFFKQVQSLCLTDMCLSCCKVEWLVCIFYFCTMFWRSISAPSYTNHSDKGLDYPDSCGNQDPRLGLGLIPIKLCACYPVGERDTQRLGSQPAISIMVTTENNNDDDSKHVAFPDRLCSKPSILTAAQWERYCYYLL